MWAALRGTRPESCPFPSGTRPESGPFPSGAGSDRVRVASGLGADKPISPEGPDRSEAQYRFFQEITDRNVDKPFFDLP